MILFDNGVLVVREISPTPSSSSGLEFGRRRFEDEPKLDDSQVLLLVEALEGYVARRGLR